MIDLAAVRYIGPPVDDLSLLGALPSELRAFYGGVNGCVLFGGGLHLRGVCRTPTWHSLAYVWRGAHALHTRYPHVTADDVPFGQDAVGDQFLLRDGIVWRLAAETGDVDSTELSFTAFMEAARADPVEFLSLWPLLQLDQEGKALQPGQLLSVYPPYCTTEAAKGVSLRAIPALERLEWLADFAAQIRAVPDGRSVNIRIAE